MTDEIRSALDPVADAFEALGVNYRVGGSVASSALGVARTTLDIEDIVIHKLDWYRMGGSISERQWADVLGVLKLQSDALDRAHLVYWAGELGLTDLLERALTEAGFDWSVIR